MSHNLYTHTCNTRQLEPQLNSSLCSSVITSHNSRDSIPSHNSRNTTCLTPISSHNSRDTFLATTQGTPASQPLKHHQSLVDHAHPKQAKHLCLSNIAQRYSRVARCTTLSDRLAGDTCRKAPSAYDATVSASIAWRDNPYRQTPHASIIYLFCSYRLAVKHHRQTLHQYLCSIGF